MKVIAYLFMTFGLLLFVFAGWYVVEAAGFIAAGETATGTIVEHKLRGSLNRGSREVGFNSGGTQVTDMYAPVVEFETKTGVVRRARTPTTNRVRS